MSGEAESYEFQDAFSKFFTCSETPPILGFPQYIRIVPMNPKLWILAAYQRLFKTILWTYRRIWTIKQIEIKNFNRIYIGIFKEIFLNLGMLAWYFLQLSYVWLSEFYNNNKKHCSPTINLMSMFVGGANLQMHTGIPGERLEKQPLEPKVPMQ